MPLGTVPDVRDRLAHVEALCREMINGINRSGLIKWLGTLNSVDGVIRWVIPPQVQQQHLVQSPLPPTRAIPAFF